MAEDSCGFSWSEQGNENISGCVKERCIQGGISPQNFYAQKLYLQNIYPSKIL